MIGQAMEWGRGANRVSARLVAAVERRTAVGRQAGKPRAFRSSSNNGPKREEQIERVMQATAGMDGDMQGIAGKTLQEIEGLEMKALEVQKLPEGDENSDHE